MCGILELSEAIHERTQERSGWTMFRERITRHYQSLSPSFKKIADYILTSHQHVSFMSASRLARHLGLDVATVTRFSQQIGYDGYVQLIREIQETVLEEMQEARAPINERLQAAQGPFDETLWRDWANLEKTIQNLPLDQAGRAIEALDSARRIYLVAEGVGGGLALAAGTYLKMIKSEVVVLREGAFDAALALKDLGPEDVVVGLGFTNYAYGATRALERARKVGAKTIGVIAQADCPVGTNAELLFACSATEEGYLPSLTGMSAILFGLIFSLYVRNADGYNQELRRFQDTYADHTQGTARGEEDVVDDLMGLF
jgi:DNA-binding MurR/RpiR family transcriptional regulator